MKFTISNTHYNLSDLARRISYKPIGHTEHGELNAVRPLSGDYPRFHAYILEGKGGIEFSLHLDQKRPSYEGSTAHSGDYNSDLIQEEARRIQEVLASAKPVKKNPFFPD
ncbi:MAG: hypothetical protein A3B25_01240 [Candidatus Ryanbacteria bacterium RIFCSPLOWO2_01_FULL_48_26]|uniref:Uncharacterized protein n=1 Tax=Candidatus Ryanbacteria bacterium RIFCSPLOWO2_01_FULL_48_26 TaxID=1802126 RepID=A0A1G2GTY9_9BACT|nr:MAG: hypothetical protein A3B25_01240 [Candidatus Ryanbacteria bacterium RIFCSPLOWO2_01_FULL_48_26]OHB20113.1 MAG: hypothetical protein A3J67_06380 [Parcubacteria group bacterium RIFCSPHIGHO2_02_FULL_48_10b]